MSDSDGEAFPRSGGFPRSDVSASKDDTAESGKKRPSRGKKFNKKKKLNAEKKGRLIVRNIPFNATEMGLLELFQTYGNVTEVKLLRKPDNKLVGCGFINFQNAKAAAKAISCISGKPYLGRPMIVDWAVPKTVFQNELGSEGKLGKMKPKQSDVEFDSEKPSYDFEVEPSHNRNDGRLFMVNLPFRISEDDLKEYLSQYGPVVDLFILKKGRKQMGNGFVTYRSKEAAEAAMKQLEGKDFQGRPLYFKWAQPKQARNQPSENGDAKYEFEVKEEPDENNYQLKSKNKKKILEPELNNTLDTSSIKSESESDDEDESESDDDIKAPKKNQNGMAKDNADSSDDSDKSDEEDDDSESSDSEQEKEKEKEENPKKKQKFNDSDDDRDPRKSNDITEGLTVFLRNIPFSVDNKELKDFITARFGPVYYALVCMDAATEHSRGTGFVKFRNKDSVDAILNAGDDLALHNEVLQASMALSREDLSAKHSVKNKGGVKNDNRNLFLSKEGLILAGSKAAKDVSMSDMNKRLSIENVRARLLKKNLLMFVSETRLVIYNLPPNYTDIKLKELFLKYSPKGAVITEARVMKDMKKFNGEGTFASREFGYVTLSSHEHALQALRNINNNPDIFTKIKRPIVLFSIENRQAIDTKLKRLEKSRRNNPLFNAESKKKKQSQERNSSVKASNAPAPTDNSFRGFTAEPGKTVLKSGHKIKKQAMTHARNVKKQKKLLRQKKQMAQLLEDKNARKEVNNKTKNRRRLPEESKDDKKFERLVSEIKNVDEKVSKKHKNVDIKVSKKFKRSNVDQETGEPQRKKKWYSQ